MKAYYSQAESRHWIVEDEVPQRYIDAWPADTVEIPAPPTDGPYIWDGVVWVPMPAPAPDLTRALSPAEFEWLLSYTGLEEIWDALIASYKETDRATYATLKANRKKSSYELALTLQIVAQFRPVAAGIDPDVDLSDEAITAAWALVAGQGL